MDKVKLYAQERLDLDDTRALQTLIYDYISEALGGLMGNAHGVLSVPVVTTFENNGAPTLYLRPFTFVTSAPMETGTTGAPLGTGVSGGTAYMQFKSIVVNYDDSEQVSTGIDIDALREDFDNTVTTFGPQYIWARPIMVDTDTATRRKWDVTSGAEVTFSDETRERQHVAFSVQNGEPPYSAGEARWAKIAQITGFTDGDNTGSVPTITWFSVFDDSLINQLLAVDDATVSMGALLALSSSFPFDTNNKSYRTFALPLLLTALREQIAQIKGYAASIPWTFATPSTHTLVGLNDRLVPLEAELAGATKCIASCRIGLLRPVPISDTHTIAASFATFSSSGVNRTFTPTGAAPEQQNRIHIAIKNDVLSQGWAITHISVTQDAVYLEDGDNRDYNRVTFLVDPSSYVHDTSDPSLMRLYDNTSTNRGVIIEVLPHVVDDPSNLGHSEDAIHPPDGSGTNATEVFNSLNDYVTTPGEASTVPPYDIIFSVAVFAVPTADADN
jgi:hypothetical protein